MGMWKKCSQSETLKPLVAVIGSERSMWLSSGQRESWDLLELLGQRLPLSTEDTEPVGGPEERKHWKQEDQVWEDGGLLWSGDCTTGEGVVNRNLFQRINNRTCRHTIVEGRSSRWKRLGIALSFLIWVLRNEATWLNVDIERWSFSGYLPVLLFCSVSQRATFPGLLWLPVQGDIDGRLESRRTGEGRVFLLLSLFLVACLAVYISSLIPVAVITSLFVDLAPTGSSRHDCMAFWTAPASRLWWHHSSSPVGGSIFRLQLVSGLPRCPLFDFLALPSLE